MLSQAEIQEIQAPIEKARTFPNHAYTQREFFDWEIRTIFRRHWMAIAFEEQLPEAGCALPIDLTGAPLLLTRDKKGLHAFHNVCPYDGSSLAVAPAKGKDRLRAPYHGWLYSLDGKLISSAHWSGNPDPNAHDLPDLPEEEVNLRPVALATHRGVVFVNLAEQPTPFEDFIAPVAALFEDLTEELEFKRTANGDLELLDFTVASNWKIVAENIFNEQHTSHTHRQYAASPEKPAIDGEGRALRIDHIDGNWFANLLPFKDFSKTYGDWTGKPHLGRDQDASGPTNAVFSVQFPNLAVAVEGAMLVYAILLPLSAESTQCVLATLGHKDYINNPVYEEDQEAGHYSYEEAVKEDGFAIEGVQRSKHSSGVNSGFYCPFWDTLHHEWNKRVLKALLQETT